MGVVLALDSGSQSSRALLFDDAGAVLAKASRAHGPFRHPAPGAVEQDPHDIRRCLFESIRQVLTDWAGDPAAIAGVALTTQRDTRLALDEGGQPIGDLESWLDRRRSTAASDPRRLVRLAFAAAGEDALVPRILLRATARRWRDERPDVVARMAKLATIESWLHHELTGRVAIAAGGLAGAVPVALGKRTWDTGPVMPALLGWERRWMCDVVDGGGRIGGISEAAAAQTGLAVGTPVFACGGDKQAEAVGAGIRPGRRGVAQISLGTASSVALTWPKPKQSPVFRYVTMCGIEPGAWHLEYMVFRGMWTVRWFAEQFAAELAAQADGRPVEALLCDAAAAVEPGAGGVMVWPRWSPSLQDPWESGTITGMREVHTRAHLFRALLEGIAYDLKRGLELLVDATGQPVAEVHVGGGGSRSDVVVQILADVLGMPVARPASEELSARGAAIAAAVGAGLHAGWAEAAAAMVPEAPRVLPRGEVSARYERIFRGAYLPGLQELRPLQQALGRLEGAG